MTIKVLDGATIRNLHSGQVIVDLEAIVKELIENSLDAHATSIELVFMNNGLESIQIKDDGDGIEEVDRLCVAKRHYTSKIKEFHDLESIETYGFRGEAMNSICSISDKFTIMTKTKADPIGKQYDVDKEGSISNEKPVNAIPKSGTIINLYKPFYNLPVRRQLAQKNATSNMKKIQELLIKYALAHPNVRLSSQQAKDTASASRNVTAGGNTWIKPVTTSITSTLGILFGAQLNDMLERFIETDPEHETLTIDAVLPKANSDPSVVLKGPERIYFYVNQRPINYVKSELKEIVTTIRTRYKDAIGLNDASSKKTPFIYIDIQMPPDEYDVNVEPNKTTILFHNKQRVINLVDKILDKVYSSISEKFFIGAAKSSSAAATAIPENADFHPDVNVAQSPPLFMQKRQQTTNVDDNIPTASTATAQPPTKQKDWSFTMMDDDEFDELISDDEEALSSVAAASRNDRAASIISKNNTPQSATNPKNTTSNNVPQPTIYHVRDTTPQPTINNVAETPEVTTNTAALGLEDWQIDDNTSTVIPPAADFLPSNGNNNTHASHLSPAAAVATNNKPRSTTTIGDALTATAAYANSRPPTTIPKKRPVEIDDDDEEVEGTRRIGLQMPRSSSVGATPITRTPPPSKPQLVQQLQLTRANTSSQVATAARNYTTPPMNLNSSANSRNGTLAPAPLTPPRRRNVPSLFNMSSSSRKKPNGDLCNTLNQAIRIDCSFENIKSSYPLRKEILAETYRIRIDDYLSVNDYHPTGQITSLLKSPPALDKYGLSFYTRGNPSTLDKCRHQVFELGVVKLKPVFIECIVNRLAREYKILVKKLFERPVQIQISHQDRLCPVLLSLKSKEQLIDDDLHGQQKVTYSEVIDENIINNGFRVRWRKDLYSGNMIVQFTGIYSLGSGYGTSDFRELLSLIATAAGSKEEFVRPKKIMDHLRSLAEEIYTSKNTHQEEEEEDEMKGLERALDGLSWKKEAEEKSDWKLGYSTANSNKVLACMLASPRIQQE